MRLRERVNGVLKAPRLTWDVLSRGRYRFVYDRMDLTVGGMGIRKRLNLVRSGANLLHRKLTAWSMPLHMQFELTNYCNLRCPVCPTGTGSVRRPPQAMSPGLFRHVIDQVAPYLLTTSLWAWGEPCLHPQLRQILAAARGRGFVVLLSTNGKNLDADEVVEALIEEPPTYLIVAIDGLTDETNSVFRKGSNLERALAGVRRLAERKRKRGAVLPVLHMRFIVMKHNEHQVPQLREFALRHQFDLLTVRTLSIIDTDAPDRSHRPLVPDDETFRAYDYRGSARRRRSDFYCLEPFWFPTLFADGTLVACEQDYNAQLPMGTLTETTDFRKVWYGAQARQARRRIRDNAGELSFCRNCPYRDREASDPSIQAHVLNERIPWDNLV